MLAEGAWNNAKSLLSDKNIKIVVNAIELLSNLTLTDTIC